jgi:hypothetical protein
MVHRRKLEDEAFERLCNAPNNPFNRFCKQQQTPKPPTHTWTDILKMAQSNANPMEPETEDEGDIFEDGLQQDDDLGLEGASLEEEADELAGDQGGVEVEVAPDGPPRPLRVLDADQLSGVWSDGNGAALPKTMEGHGEGRLRANGRTIATFRGTFKQGEPHGYGRLEMGLDGWSGQMAHGLPSGNGEAWDEAGNKFTGRTSAPRWLLDQAASEVQQAASAARKANAPFNVKNERAQLKSLKVIELRAALRNAGADDAGLKDVLLDRLVETQRQAHLARQSNGAHHHEVDVGYEGMRV